ncbi:S-layer homology domain-containing protein [Paenibacillus sp. GCM10012307]|uniref:S-layer homology domain-containing protein n=1 Tax=Paenibacillus roseus TaxID=2798579 RepID=A0A934J8X1_9BACL|nr:S-layer homology domain-containing protein [Paenibacillus roseus]MBJ6362602.1 S-layer homology domain-containing protein [Paenibacillus roseus]
MIAKRPSVYKLAIAVMCLSIAALAGVYMAKAEPESWDGYAQTDWYNETYVTFTIDSKEKLAGVAKLVNTGVSDTGVQINGFSGKILEIDRNLDLSDYLWTPIGSAEHPFKGTLIAEGGKVFTISGMNVSSSDSYWGLVGYMEGGTVGGFKFTADGSLTVTNSGRDVYAGAAVGKMTDSSIVYQITNYIPIHVQENSHKVRVGGIVGAGDGAVSSSSNEADVTAFGSTAAAGGIAGQGGLSGLRIKKTENHGAVATESDGTGDVYAGGIVGHAQGSLRMNEENTPVANTGAITAEYGEHSYAGGLVGRAGADIAFSELSANSGSVTVDAPQALGSFAGGLIGEIGAAQNEPLFQIQFTSSAPVTNHGGANVHTGGVAGRIDSSLTWGRNFTNQVDIAASGQSEVYTGGLIGSITGDLRFLGAAVNSAAVTVTGNPNEAYTGGLIGSASQRVLLDHTVAEGYANRGKLVVEGGKAVYTGGIVSNQAYATSAGGAAANVVSIGDISVKGQTELYTGGYIGRVDGNKAADTAIDSATFAHEIQVTAAESGGENGIYTGGIVGAYYAGTAISNTSFTGRIDVQGKSAAYTGGIAGYLDGGTIKKAKAGYTAANFAKMTSDGTLGGIAGYVNGTITETQVRYLALQVKPHSVAGGVAGWAQGEISQTVVGAADTMASDSVTFAAALDNAASGSDKIIAGGIIGANTDELAVTESEVTRITLITETGRSGYTFGAVAGQLTSDAVIGSLEKPVQVHHVAVEAQASDSLLGGVAGMNEASKVHVSVEQLELNLKASAIHAGGIAAVNSGEIAAQASVLNVKDSKFVSSGANNRVGGVFGENKGQADNAQADHVMITSTGTGNRIGAIAGVNSGVLTGSKASYAVIAASGEKAEAGGIAGRLETAAGSGLTAAIKNAVVLAGEEALLTADGAESAIGGIAGVAKDSLILNSVVQAVIPDYAVLSVKGTKIAAGAIAGQAEDSHLSGDAVTVNAENVMLSTTASGTEAHIGGLIGHSVRTKTEKLVGNKVNLILNGEKAAAGGIAGYNQGSNEAMITGTYLTELNIRVNPSAQFAVVGGFVGRNAARNGDTIADPATGVSTIQASRVSGSIQTNAPSSVTGGMVGENSSLIANNSITEKNSLISKGNNSIAGGLVGLNKEAGAVYYTYSNANMSIEGEGTLTGGLVGDNKGRIIASYIDNDLTSRTYGKSENPVFTGGIAGRNTGVIEKSYAVSNVRADGSYSIVGGLVGEHAAGTIDHSYTARSVAATKDHSYAGGFIGRIVAGKVSHSYSASRVSAASDAFAGGFAGRYDNTSKELLYKSYYIKDEDKSINKDLPDFADGKHRFLNVHARLSTILAETLEDRNVFPGLSGWDFTNTWRYGSLNAAYKYPELNRVANSGGGGGHEDVNQNIRWYMLDKDAINFEISTEAELAGLAAIVNGTVPGERAFNFEGRNIRVTKPIHIQSKQWAPIGDRIDHAFQGSFAAGGHLIDGLAVTSDLSYAGLFGVIGTKGEVLNVKLEPLAVAGKHHAGVLAGLNQGRISDIDVRLLNGVEISGQTVGGLIGENTGQMEKLQLTLDGGSRIVGNIENAVVGGIAGKNKMAIDASLYSIQAPDGEITATADGATVGGLFGEQTGDVTGLNIEVVKEYRVSASGKSNVVGGIIGRYVSGKAQDITLTFKDGHITASGQGSVAGGVIGHSEPGNAIIGIRVIGRPEPDKILPDNAVSGDEAGTAGHIVSSGAAGGVVGMKEGKGTNAYDIRQVRVERLDIHVSADDKPAVSGGIAGWLMKTAMFDAYSQAVIRAGGADAAVGGIAGMAHNSILNKSVVIPDIVVEAASGASAVGGVTGSLSSDDLDRAFDFGQLIPFYSGIYQADVQRGQIQLTTGNGAADLTLGGITGVNADASIYYANAEPQLKLSGGRTAAAGGAVGESSGILVHVKTGTPIQAETSSIYHVGGVVGKSTAGEIHYSEAAAVRSGKIEIGNAVTRPGVVPSAHAGGFIGMGDHTKISHSSTDIPVQVQDTNQDNTIYAGGFAGLLGDTADEAASIDRVYAKGNITVKGITGAYAGGFAGSVDKYKITDAYASGNVQNTGFDTRSGGFAAAVEREADIKRAYAINQKVETVGINHATRAYAGGFAGYNDGQLTEVYANVPVLTINVSGANVYKGALIGYQFRQGKLKDSAYTGVATPVGYNLGQVTGTAAVEAQDMTPVLNWNFELDTTFLNGEAADGLIIRTVPQLAGAVHLYNASGLPYYQLFNRAAETKPEFERIQLAADLDLAGIAWNPFDSFTGVFDGDGHVISGLQIKETESSGPAAFIRQNKGTVTNIRFENVSVTGGAHTAIVAGTNEQGAVIQGVVIKNAKVAGTNYTGGVAGRNKGSLAQTQLSGLTLKSNGIAGGAAGINEGRISNVSTAGRIELKAAYAEQAVRGGGIAGENLAGAAIDHSFSYADLKSEAAEAQTGGISGLNAGEISFSYYSGRAESKGTAKAWTGGIAGSTVGGAISNAWSAGEVIASVNGKHVPGVTFFGGIAGQKTDSAAISNTVFNKQQLKQNTAYYNSDSKPVGGSGGEAQGVLAKELAQGVVPSQLDTAKWKAVQGHYPQLAGFYGTDKSAISAAAILLDAKDTINRINAPFELTGTGVTWSANAAEAVIEKQSAKVKGALKTTGTAVLTVAAGEMKRQIVIHSPAVQYAEKAKTPFVESGDASFTDQVSVVLGVQEPGAAIYYTIDGKQPTEESARYTGPIVLKQTTTIKAIAVVAEKEISDVFTGVWTKNTPPVSGGGGFIPVQPEQPESAIQAYTGQKQISWDKDTPVSIARNSRLALTAPAGQIIYYTTDGSTPTVNSQQYKGEIIITGSITIKVITNKNNHVMTMRYEVANAGYELKQNASQIKYMKGYSNNLFKPDLAMTRYELIGALAPLLDKENVTVASLFSDVGEKQANEVAFFASAGIIQGYPNGTFGGEKPLTRAEFVVMLSRVLHVDVSRNSQAGSIGAGAGTGAFTDVKGHWSEPYVQAFVKEGYVKGFPDGTFRPDSKLSRAEAVVLINRATGVEKKKLPAKYTDLQPSHWAYEDIMPVVQ